MSTSPFGIPMHPSLPPSSTYSKSNPGGRNSSTGISPFRRVIMQVPHVPEVQLVGILTPQSIANSQIVCSETNVVWPSNFTPRKNRIKFMCEPHRSSHRVQRPVCLLKYKPAFFIHLLNLVAPAPVLRMKSSRSSWA